MKKIFSFFAIYLLFFSFSAFALIERHAEIDLAFSLLEEDNIFLKRYNAITNAGIQARFALGLPYLYGGQNAEKILQKAPAYSIREAFENSAFYRKGWRYLHGFDCRGFALWINEETGKKPLDQLSTLLSRGKKYKHNRLFSHRNKKALPLFSEMKEHLQIGDYLIARSGSPHIMMYIGTLSDYGFTKEELPALSKYLDYPLAIHSGPNPQYGERIQKLIDEDETYSKCNTTDGGVCISIVGVPLHRATHQVMVQKNNYHYFWLDEGKYMLTIWDFYSASSFVWFRSDTLSDKK